MKPFVVPTAMLAVVVLAAPRATSAETVRVPLRLYEEVPSVSSAVRGSFRADIKTSFSQIAYQLQYERLTGEVRQGHIHLSQRDVNGGISVILCQTAANPDPTGLAPACPASGKVSGVLTIANIVGPAGQGIAAGEFAKLVAAIRAGVAYVNVPRAPSRAARCAAGSTAWATWCRTPDTRAVAVAVRRGSSVPALSPRQQRDSL